MLLEEEFKPHRSISISTLIEEQQSALNDNGSDEFAHVVTAATMFCFVLCCSVLFVSHANDVQVTTRFL